MSIKERIQISLLIERMNRNKSYSEKLGLENRSTFQGELINKKEKD